MISVYCPAGYSVFYFIKETIFFHPCHPRGPQGFCERALAKISTLYKGLARRGPGMTAGKDRHPPGKVRQDGATGHGIRTKDSNWRGGRV